MSGLFLPPGAKRNRRGSAILAVAATLTVGSGGCGGYADLPLRQRAFAPMMITQTTNPSRLGPTTLQLTIQAPTALTPDAFPLPWVIVGHPTIQSLGGRVIAWARGPCDVSQAGPIDAFVVCAAVRWDDSDTPPESPVVSIVVESRATAQRVTFFGELIDAVPATEVSTP